MLRTLLIAAAVGANAAFAGLAMVFDYPDVLDRPAADALDSFHANQPAVPLLFLLLAASAALLAPISIGLARRSTNPRPIVVFGVAAAVVQVIGLLRWPIVVPFLTDPAVFRTLSTVLGTIIGETLGYLCTAAFTLAVVRALPGLAPAVRWLGITSAALIATGVLTPLHVPGADLANFGGYLLWSGWLVMLAIVLNGARFPALLDRAFPAQLSGKEI